MHQVLLVTAVTMPLTSFGNSTFLPSPIPWSYNFGVFGGTNWQATMLPVETIMPFFRRLPCSASLCSCVVRCRVSRWWMRTGP